MLSVTLRFAELTEQVVPAGAGENAAALRPARDIEHVGAAAAGEVRLLHAAQRDRFHGARGNVERGVVQVEQGGVGRIRHRIGAGAAAEGGIAGPTIEVHLLVGRCAVEDRLFDSREVHRLAANDVQVGVADRGGEPRTLQLYGFAVGPGGARARKSRCFGPAVEHKLGGCAGVVVAQRGVLERGEVHVGAIAFEANVAQREAGDVARSVVVDQFINAAAAVYRASQAIDRGAIPFARPIGEVERVGAAPAGEIPPFDARQHDGRRQEAAAGIEVERRVRQPIVGIGIHAHRIARSGAAVDRGRQ